MMYHDIIQALERWYIYMKRIRLCDRKLPNYSRGEEIMNMVTHITGGALGVIALILCVVTAAFSDNLLGIIGSAVYGLAMITLYTISSVYHGLHPNTGKKVLQVIDHCMIYVLIAGTYTPIMLSSFVPIYPIIGWGMLGAQWFLAALAITLTAIDLHAYSSFSMICYIAMGWGIILFIPQTMHLLSPAGFWLLFSGGVVYTIGAILYGIGIKVKWMHSIFHIFVVIGSLLQFLSILLYSL